MAVSVMVVDQREATRAAAESGRGHAQRVGQALTALLEPFRAEDEPAIDGTAFMMQLVRMAEASQEKVNEADAKNDREQGDLKAPREERDNQSNQIYTALVAVRALFELLGGTKATAALGFQGNTPRVPELVADLAQKVSERLPTVKKDLPEVPGVKVDVPELTASLVTPLPALRAAQHWLLKESKEAEASLMDKWRSMEAHDATLRQVVGLLSLVMELAGFPELAERVLPTQPKAASPAPAPHLR